MEAEINELFNVFFTAKVKPEILITFFRQLGTLVKAGIPLYQSMQIIIKQTKDKHFHKIAVDILKGLHEGETLAACLSDYKKVFSPFIISTVSVGEARGSLGDDLENIEKHLVKTRDIRNKIISSLTYPLLLILTGIGVLFIMLTLVLPKFVAIFEETNISLPKPTKILVSINQFLHSYYQGIFAALIILIILFYITYLSRRGRKAIDYIILKTFVVGRILTNIYAARFSRTFGTLYASGIPIIRALTLTKNSFKNRIWYDELTELTTKIEGGESFGSAINSLKALPEIMKQMLAVGDESGAIDKLALETASYYEDETEYDIQKYLSLLEPIALIIIAVAVAFMSASVLLPMFKMASGIRSF